MGDSLRDQLLRSGLVKSARERPAARRTRRVKQGSEPTFPPQDPAVSPSRSGGKVGSDPIRGDVDLARAWAMRERAESAERKRARAAADAEARARKEMLQRLRQVVDGKALNCADAELVRHFEYGGRIRRVHVNADQLADINGGRLGVVQLKGGYVLVTRAVAETVREFAPGHVALLVSPDAVEPDDGVPDDLTW